MFAVQRELRKSPFFFGILGLNVALLAVPLYPCITGYLGRKADELTVYAPGKKADQYLLVV